MFNVGIYAVTVAAATTVLSPAPTYSLVGHVILVSAWLLCEINARWTINTRRQLPLVQHAVPVPCYFRIF